MKRVLVAYDGSPCADAALDDLVHAALPDGTEFEVLTVADVWLPTAEAVGAQPVLPDTFARSAERARMHAARAVADAEATARRAAARLQAMFPAWRISAVACADSPAWATLRRADRWPADLIVVGSHSHSKLERLFLGSVSQKVTAEARCSVRVARPHARAAGPLRLLLAVDGSGDSLAALNEVAARPWPAGTQAQVVTVLDPRLETAVAWPEVYAAQWEQQRDEEAREWLARVVEHAAHHLHGAGLAVDTHIFDGDAKRTVLRRVEDWDADTVFLGARGLHHGNRYFLGTFASAVATRAHCTVEIVRPRLA